jgi:hypothetical protein
MKIAKNSSKKSNAKVTARRTSSNFKKPAAKKAAPKDYRPTAAHILENVTVDSIVPEPTTGILLLPSDVIESGYTSNGKLWMDVRLEEGQAVRFVEGRLHVQSPGGRTDWAAYLTMRAGRMAVATVQAARAARAAERRAKKIGF